MFLLPDMMDWRVGYRIPSSHETLSLSQIQTQNVLPTDRACPLRLLLGRFPKLVKTASAQL